VAGGERDPAARRGGRVGVRARGRAAPRLPAALVHVARAAHRARADPPGPRDRPARRRLERCPPARLLDGRPGARRPRRPRRARDPGRRRRRARLGRLGRVPARARSSRARPPSRRRLHPPPLAAAAVPGAQDLAVVGHRPGRDPVRRGPGPATPPRHVVAADPGRDVTAASRSPPSSSSATTTRSSRPPSCACRGRAPPRSRSGSSPVATSWSTRTRSRSRRPCSATSWRPPSRRFVRDRSRTAPCQRWRRSGVAAVRAGGARGTSPGRAPWRRRSP
jgi:hypothetical protein